MNKINPVKINSTVQEISSKKEVIKETAQQAVQEIKTQASNLGRDLVRTAGTGAKVSASELLAEGYQIGQLGVIYKMDHKKYLYSAVQFSQNKVKNITIQDTSAYSKKAVITEKVDNGKWFSNKYKN